MKPNINSVEVHPQPSNNRYPADGALLGAGSLWPAIPYLLGYVQYKIICKTYIVEKKKKNYC